MKNAKQQFIANKIKKIKDEGIRGKPVPQKQAVAVALNYARRKDAPTDRFAGGNAGA